MADRVKKIYIAGKLNAPAADYIKNLSLMLRWALKVRRLGFSVYVPGLDILLGLMAGNWDYDDYFENSQVWLEASDAVLLLPNWIDSEGAKREIELAKEKGIPVFETIKQLEQFE